MTLKITHPIEDALMSPCLKSNGHREGGEFRRGSRKSKKDSREGKRKETRRERWVEGRKS